MSRAQLRTRPEFGVMIQEARLDLGKSLETVAQDAEMSARTLLRWEQGHAPDLKSYDSFRRVAGLLRLDYRDLLLRRTYPESEAANGGARRSD